jgi:hypothetical protein
MSKGKILAIVSPLGALALLLIYRKKRIEANEDAEVQEKQSAGNDSDGYFSSTDNSGVEVTEETNITDDTEEDTTDGADEFAGDEDLPPLTDLVDPPSDGPGDGTAEDNGLFDDSLGDGTVDGSDGTDSGTADTGTDDAQGQEHSEALLQRLAENEARAEANRLALIEQEQIDEGIEVSGRQVRARQETQESREEARTRFNLPEFRSVSFPTSTARDEDLTEENRDSRDSLLSGLRSLQDQLGNSPGGGPGFSSPRNTLDDGLDTPPASQSVRKEDPGNSGGRSPGSTRSRPRAPAKKPTSKKTPKKPTAPTRGGTPNPRSKRNDAIKKKNKDRNEKAKKAIDAARKRTKARGR